MNNVEKSFNDYVVNYKKELAKDDIQIAYEKLIKYVMSLKASFENQLSEEYSFGNISPGYMDITYFSFYNSYLRDKLLRFGIVLNHKDMQFELWLMGRNAKVQQEYWELLKDTKWNKHRDSIPRYSFLEIILVENPDFNDLPKLSDKIIKVAEKNATEVLEYLQKNTSIIDK